MSQYYSIYVGQTSLISTKVQFLIQLQYTCLINHWSKQTKNFKLGTRDCRNGAFSVCKLLEVLTVVIGAGDPFPVLGRLTQHAPPPPNEGGDSKTAWLKITTPDNLFFFRMTQWRGKKLCMPSSAHWWFKLWGEFRIITCFRELNFRSCFRLWWYIRIIRKLCGFK